MNIGSRNEAGWAWVGMSLVVAALFAVVCQWGGTIWSAPAVMAGFYVIFVLLLVSLVQLLIVKEVSVGALLSLP